MSYQSENNEFINNFVDNSFYKSWKTKKETLLNFSKLELGFSPECNLDCKYCYYAKHGSEIYPKEIRSKEDQKKNLQLVLDFLSKNDYSPNIDYFSGEPLSTDFGIDCLNIILNHFEHNNNRPTVISIPTNFTFFLYDGFVEKVENTIERGRKLGIRVSLSASFDGKYMEDNRPSNSNLIRDDNYYDRCFSFASKHGFGFHPMIYSENIDNWERNFLWFQDMFNKHGNIWHLLYLLEVRDSEWTGKQIESYGKFVEFLVDWVFDKVGKERFVDFIIRKGFNLLKSPLTTVGRGLGCSIQSTLSVRLGDLSIIPCHRLSYKPLNYGKFLVEDGKITTIEANNIELMNSILSFKATNQPYCSCCSIKNLCSFGCLGSQFETNGELFTPIPTVCAMYKQKMVSIVRGLMKHGVFNDILQITNDRKEYELRRIGSEL